MNNKRKQFKYDEMTVQNAVKEIRKDEELKKIVKRLSLK